MVQIVISARRENYQSTEQAAASDQTRRRGAIVSRHAMASPAEQETQPTEAPSSSREEVNIWFCSKNKGVKALGNSAHTSLYPLLAGSQAGP